MIRLSRPSRTELDALLESASHSEPTYRPVGATRDRVDKPAGFRQQERSVTIRAANAFSRSKDALRQWQVHSGAGGEVFLPRFEEASTILLLFKMGICVIAPCRIVYLVDEDDIFGFAYGTLPGHPEQGEEAFLVERVDSDHIRFVIRSFSRPGDPIVKMTAPVARLIQSHMTNRYLRALGDFLRDSR